MRLTISSLANGGDGVAKTNEGKTLFVPDTAPGDVIEAEITEEKKSYGRARIVEILEPSADRVEPFCPYAHVCGGCDWQHLSYEAQLKAKQKNLCDSLLHIGAFRQERVDESMKKIIPSPLLRNYRNKVEFECGKDAKGSLIVGLHARNSNEIIPIDCCPLLPKGFENAPKALQGALRYLSGKGDLGIKRITLRVSTITKSVEVALWTKPSSFPRKEAADVLSKAVPLTSLTRVIFKGELKERNVTKVEVLCGDGYWKERLCGHTFKLSSPSFFQVNTAAAEVMVNTLIGMLDPKDTEIGYDLYCGAGSFTLPLAARAKEVNAIENYGSSIRDLRRNLDDNKIDNVSAIGGNVSIEIDKINKADIVIMDPPFSGLDQDKNIINTLHDVGATRIGYVSCNPTTLARDLSAMLRYNWQHTFYLAAWQPIDLFPQTSHVETITFFTAAE